MATEVATTSEGRTSQVRIHLTTTNQDIELPQDVGSILVPTEAKRYQLSTLVNRLLDTEKPIPLEFLINGQFLRTSLDEFLTQNGISAETTLSVEYVKALIPPLYSTSFEHEDWVSSVDVLSPSSNASKWSKEGTNNQRILSSSYDGALRVWNLSSEVVATGQAQTSAVKTAKFLSPTQIASAGVDRCVRLWNFSDAEVGQGSLNPALELYGHTASIDKLSVHTPSSRILTASSDSTIGLWSPKKADAPAAPEELLPSSSSSNKRRKISNPGKAVPQRGALSTLRGHSAPVSEAIFDEKDATVAYSSSWDHTVKTWDLTTSQCVDTRTTAQSLFSLCHLPSVSLLATGTVNRHITLIDPRASAATVSAMTLRGHTNAVVSLARDPSSGYQLLSGSHDGTCRIWDIRSVRNELGAERVGDSVYVIERESAKEKAKSAAGEGVKVMGVCWDRDVGIVSGGEDQRVQINRSVQ
ncbi:hypothetical protein MBLNU230_g5989t1 [Neophaeotheca triangularis]